MKAIYLARPIDYTDAARREALQATADRIRSAVRASPDHVLFDPAAAFEVGFTKAEESNFILSTNSTAIEESDLVVALWPAGSSSWGVPAEVQFAQDLSLKVHIVTDAPRSWAMPTNATYYRADTMEEATFALLRALKLDMAGVKLVKRPERPALQFARVRPDEWYEKPTRGYATDAGLDLYVSRETHVPAYGFVDVPSNTAVDLPPGTWGYLTGRSSTLRKKGLLVNPGVIDYSYTGELFSGVQNMTGGDVVLKQGERIAQLIVLPMVTHNHEIQTVGGMPIKDRGSNGFGSSGV